MLLRKFLTNFSLLESLCTAKSVLLPYTSENAGSFSKLIRNMGCSISKGTKVLNINEKKKQRPSMTENADYVEGVVCKNSDVKEKEMKIFDLADAGQVLVVRQNGKLSALGTKCTHYAAPLEESALGEGRLRCQWHGACFSLATGDIEDFPGLDSLPCYQVTVEGDDVKVRARRSELQTNKRIKLMANLETNCNQHFVIIGGGPSGAICAETLRQEGFKGKITVVAKENYLPYDRIKINKYMNSKYSDLQLRQAEFYKSHGIDVITGCEAVGLDTDLKEIKLHDGRTFHYSAAYLATGSSARKIDIPGAQLKNVVVIREYDDVGPIDAFLGPTKHVVVLGSSFIGMEAAAYCIDKTKNVTVVSKDSVPFEASLGKEVGAGVKKMFEDKGINFIPKSGLNRCIDNGSGAIGSVELADGSILQADLCIMGVGSTLNTQFLKNSGITINNNGSVEVNNFLQTNVPNVFAGGDIANAPVWCRDGYKAAIGHYGLAQYHGKMAAMNMLDKKVPIKTIPFFWTFLFGIGIRYCGHGRYDDVIYSGDPKNLDYVAFYLKGDEVIAISDCNNLPIASIYGERIALGKKLYRNDLKDDPLAWSR